MTPVKSADEITLPKPVKDEYGQILVESAMPAKPKIILPLSKNQTQQAIHVKVVESIRWLAEWCLRLIKMFPRRTVYKTQ